MIQVTRFNGMKIYLNAEMVQTVEEMPDTLITLTNNERILVGEKSVEVVKRIIETVENTGFLRSRCRFLGEIHLPTNSPTACAVFPAGRPHGW
jgi:flagellar protein FlbD